MSKDLKIARSSIGHHASGIVATVLALIACYGTLALVSGLSIVGVALEINNGIWAVTIVALFGIAVGFIAFHGNRKFGPAVLAAVAFVLILFVMFGSYHWATELVAFAGLTAAAFWKRSALNTQQREHRSKQKSGFAEGRLTRSSAT